MNHVFAQDEWYNYERIMLIKSQRHFILSEGLITYNKDNKWYLPLEDLFDAIGIEYKFAKNQRVIEGFVFNERNSYRIDLNSCEIFINDSKVSFDCNSFIPLDDFLLVDTQTLELLTTIKFNIQSLNSSIILDYEPLFPPEEREKRNSKKSGAKKSETSYPVEINKREWIDGLNFDQDISLDSFRSRNGDIKTSLKHETALSAEVLKSELYTNYRGIDDKKESYWLGLERNDYRSRVFGDLGLSEVKLVNFNAPSVALVGGGQKLTGAYFSNRSLLRPINFSKESFSGTLESGWEVELYHNDVLIGREVGSSVKQRYEFNNIDLYYGVNRFKFIFYGPKGERRYENKTLNISNTFDKSSQVTITGAFGEDQNDKENYSLSLSKNIFDRVQLDLHTVKNYDLRTNKTNTYYGGAFSTFFNNTLIDTNYITDEEDRVFETSAKFNFLGVNTNLSYINNTGVASDTLGHTNPIDYSWNGNFLLPLRFVQNLQMFNSIKYKKKYGVDVSYVDILSRISFSIQNLYLSNSVNVENNILVNEFFSRYSSGQVTYKFTTRTDRDGLRDSEVDYSFSNRRKHSYSGSLAYEYSPKITSLSIRADKKFKKIFAGISLEGNSESEFGIALNLSYGAVYDRDDGIHLFNKRTSEYANIKALAYHDINGDGKRDSGEEIIKNIEFYRLSGNERQPTNDRGYAFFTFIQPLTPTDIKISLAEIDNIYLRPSTIGKRVWGRAGKTALVEFPLQIEGDVEGEVELIESTNKKVSLKGSIISNGKTIKSFNIEKDGYFYSQGILPGEYTLKVECDECSLKEFTKRFKMPSDGDSLFFEGVRL